MSEAYTDQTVSMRFLGLTVALALSAVSLTAQTPFTGSCAEDDHIPAAKRQLLNEAALRFVMTLTGENPGSAFDQLTSDAQRNAPREEIVKLAAVMLRPFNPHNPAVRHSYFVELTGKGAGRVICGDKINVPLSRTVVAAADAPQQGHAIVTVDLVNDVLAVTCWLLPERGVWKVHSFSLNQATVGDKGPEQLREMAQAEVGRGHLFNATLLYAAALRTANRGGDLELGILTAINEDASLLEVPAELRGQPPYLWKGPAREFEVKQVGPIAIGGEINLMVDHVVPAWTSDAQVDGWNKELMTYLKSRFPEYTGVFQGLIVRGHERGGARGYGTVEETPASK